MPGIPKPPRQCVGAGALLGGREVAARPRWRLHPGQVLSKASLAEPPGPIDNSRIAQVKGSGHVQLKPGESCVWLGPAGRRPHPVSELPRWPRGPGDKAVWEVASPDNAGSLPPPYAPASLPWSVPAGADYGQISEETWTYLNHLYGGGPEIAIRQSVVQLADPESLHGEQKIEAETRAV